ncbi:MAG: N-acetylmuramoyl-L-alanine amidase [Magnetovibrionaceae bacterium]
MLNPDDVKQRPSPNFGSRKDGKGVDMLVIHYTGMQSAEAALERLCDTEAQVSAHWLIEEDGTLWSLVAEEMRAWHAGHSFWRGETDINSRSVGIELVNPGHEFGYRPFPEAQVQRLIGLCSGIVKTYAIPPDHVLGHSDVAPDRKVDPGELFPWRRLAEAGIGLLPEDRSPGRAQVRKSADEPDQARAKQLLAEIGYATENLSASIGAFQRRYRQDRVDDVLDHQTMGLIEALHSRLRPLA